jgi:uncharacterized protein (TIGR00299 family) protein
MTDVALKLDPEFDLGALLAVISIDEYDLSVARARRASLSGLRVEVRPRAHGGAAHHHHRTLPDIMDILLASGISEDARRRAGDAFALLAGAEGAVHGISPDEVHFHEVGAVDSIVDIVGAMLLMERLGWPRILSSPVNVGSGTVRCEHGVLPVPAPATALLLEGCEVYSAGDPAERTTPTGALLLKVLVGRDGFGDMPRGRIIHTGTGLGGRDTPDMPNVLRAMLIEPADGGEPSGRFVCDSVSLLESNIDDMNPQDFSLAVERLFSGGALDVWCENVLMKKGRPAVKLCCLVGGGEEERFAEIMLRETTTIGVRVTSAGRFTLRRAAGEFQASCGGVRWKSVSLDGQALRRSFEYDDLLDIARAKNMPMREVREIIRREAEDVL